MAEPEVVTELSLSLKVGPAEPGREQTADRLLADAYSASTGGGADTTVGQLLAVAAATQAQAEATLALAAEVRELRRFLVELEATGRVQ
jgi:hypothetical protein